ncbi:winged helix-turn-helix transcriptional regulator [Saccharothrix obliqua]|uniref:winged helix-turn-helix transcriptional regulator n=1 Tax=Saccharothrix obliqua TaxID=2861747 RepID=UPI001C5E8411|nr:winged helix-turn-helix transcriptional regulator [Saccharothrix obliqua]MBW4722028.1 winged helix-turn-helix transcriptional regulator [Saccharothrix obliqua]
MSSKRDYGQFCGLAGALNVIGERWTLLVVRELLIGPARFTELIDDLPGIGPNLLTERLRGLVERGVVTQQPVPGDGRARQYALTPVGEELAGPVLALARWGLRFLDEEDSTGATRAKWGFLAVQAMVREDRVPDVDEVYEFRVAGQVFTIAVTAGAVAFGRGPRTAPDLAVECDADTFVRIGARMLSPLRAIATGAVKISGSPAAAERCTRMLGLT